MALSSAEETRRVRAWAAIHLLGERANEGFAQKADRVTALYVFDDPVWAECGSGKPSRFLSPTYFNFTVLLVKAGFKFKLLREGEVDSKHGKDSLLAAIQVVIADLTPDQFRERYEILKFWAPMLLGKPVPLEELGKPATGILSVSSESLEERELAETHKRQYAAVAAALGKLDRFFQSPEIRKAEEIFRLQVTDGVETEGETLKVTAALYLVLVDAVERQGASWRLIKNKDGTVTFSAFVSSEGEPRAPAVSGQKLPPHSSSVDPAA